MSVNSRIRQCLRRNLDNLKGLSVMVIQIILICGPVVTTIIQGALILNGVDYCQTETTSSFPGFSIYARAVITAMVLILYFFIDFFWADSGADENWTLKDGNKEEYLQRR